MDNQELASEEIMLEGSLSNDKNSTVETRKEEDAVSPEANLLCEVKQIQEAIAKLQNCFDKKIAVDQHKNQLFDTMHSQLVDYQDGSIDKLINAIGVDIIQVIDSVEKTYMVYAEYERTGENYEKLLNNNHNLIKSLQEILYRQGIESYQGEGDSVDVRRQKIIGTVPTEKEEKDNRICRRVGDGYEKNGKVIRPERVIIYKFAPDNK